jgi:hypothetical protein
MTGNKIVTADIMVKLKVVKGYGWFKPQILYVQYTQFSVNAMESCTYIML